MTRWSAGLMASHVPATSVAGERDVVLGTGAAALHGTLALPPGDGPVPGVLILAGSGPTDRDGNTRLPGGGLLRTDALRLLALGLAERGIAALRVDKRGIGASSPALRDEASLRFGDLVDDAAAWTERLRAERRIGPVLLLGHSEGALVATLAARQARPAGLILVAGPGEPAGRVLRRQLEAGGVPEVLRARAEDVLAELEAGRQVSDPPPQLAALFRPSVQPYLISWLPLDPSAQLREVVAPVLIVQGTTDIQVGVNDARRLAAVRPDARLLLVEGMNHVLKSAPAERAANLKAYADPTLALAPGLIEGIANFVTRTS